MLVPVIIAGPKPAAKAGTMMIMIMWIGGRIWIGVRIGDRIIIGSRILS